MTGFEKYGEAMLLAHDGNVQLGSMLAETVKRLAGRLGGWMRAMPTNLPPTESFPRK